MDKYALITGASKGIGKEFAIKLSSCGYKTILVARNRILLEDLANTLPTDSLIFDYDISDVSNIYTLFEQIEDLNIEVVINNAGFGECAKSLDISDERELNMIDLNVKAMQIVAKLSLKHMKKGYILNVASTAGIMPAGPYMATYYATKAYVKSYTLALAFETKKENKDIHISCLCPGPVDTNFNNEAHVKFSLKGISSKKCVDYAYKKMMKNKRVIVPSFIMRVAVFYTKLLPSRYLIWVTSKQQKKKIEA